MNGLREEIVAALDRYEERLRREAGRRCGGVGGCSHCNDLREADEIARLTARIHYQSEGGI